MATTYSFLDVNASIVGPGGAFNLGSGSGVDKEGIDIVANEDIDSMQIGADGEAMHSLVANKAGRITVRLLKTSPVNAQLSAMVAFQRTSGANHGQNTISLVNKVTGDTITCQLVAFAKIPDLKFGAEAGSNAWEFNAGSIDPGLGNG